MTNTRRAILTTLSLFSASISQSACNAPQDFYSQVYKTCNFPIPDLGTVLLHGEQAAGYLTDDCRDALDNARGGIVPFDSESWKNAPEGMKERVLEAFQALIAYPIAIPSQNRLIGVADDPAGAIPGDFINILHGKPGETNPNQALFNWILNKVDTVKYDSSASDKTAMYIPQLDFSEPRLIKIYPTFWDPKDQIMDLFRHPFERASTLVHEAYHGTGQTHQLCQDTSQGINCDIDLKGPYGFELSYLHYLTMGSGTCAGEGCIPPLKGLALTLIGYELCHLVQDTINHPFPQLAARLQDADGNWIKCSNLSANQFLELEGLPPLPEPTDAPAPNPD